MQEQIIERKIRFFAIDAYELAKKRRHGHAHQHDHADLLLRDRRACCRATRRSSTSRSRSRRPTASAGRRSCAATARSWIRRCAHLHEIPCRPRSAPRRSASAARVGAGARFRAEGDGGDAGRQRAICLPVSAFPVDGTWPTATAKWEKRNLALEIPVWDSKICIQCNQCALVCPHAAIRAKVYDEGALRGRAVRPSSRRSFKGNEHKGKALHDSGRAGGLHRLQPVRQRLPGQGPHQPEAQGDRHASAGAAARARARQLRLLPRPARARSDRRSTKLDHKSSQFLEPLFEYSGACAGCGETPYLKLLTQLFGDRLLIANATGCSSIYGGNLPTTPYTTNRDGRGPAWSNSLFEDNAEFEFGFRMALDAHAAAARGAGAAPRAADRRRARPGAPRRGSVERGRHRRAARSV